MDEHCGGDEKATTQESLVNMEDNTIVSAQASCSAARPAAEGKG